MEVDRKGLLEGILYSLALILSVYLIAYSYVSGAYVFYKVPPELIEPGLGVLVASLAVLALASFIFSPLVTALLVLVGKNEIVRVVFWFLFWWYAYVFFAGFNLVVTIIFAAVLVFVLVAPVIKYIKVKGSYGAKLAKKTADEAGIRVKILEYLSPRYKILAVMVLVLCFAASHAGFFAAKSRTGYTYLKKGDTSKSAYFVVGKFKDSFVCKKFSWKKGFSMATTRVELAEDLSLGKYSKKPVKKKSKKKK